MCKDGSFLEFGGEESCGKCFDNGVCSGGYIPMVPKAKVLNI